MRGSQFAWWLFYSNNRLNSEYNLEELIENRSSITPQSAKLFLRDTGHPIRQPASQGLLQRTRDGGWRWERRLWRWMGRSESSCPEISSQLLRNRTLENKLPQLIMIGTVKVMYNVNVTDGRTWLRWCGRHGNGWRWGKTRRLKWVGEPRSASTDNISQWTIESRPKNLQQGTSRIRNSKMTMALVTTRA